MMHRWLFTLTLCLPVLAHAATFHVAPAGRDSNPCTASAPCHSIGHATAVMHGGDTVIVHAGTYTEGNIVMPNGSAAAPSTLQVNPGDTVTINSPAASVDCLICFNRGANWQVVDGFILNGLHQTIFVVYAVANTSNDFHHLTVQNCEITSGRAQGMLLSGDHWTILHNNVHDNGTDIKLHHGIYFSGSDSMIQENFLHDNACYGLQNYNSHGLNTSNNTYLNNTFTHNGCGVVIAQGSGHIFAHNVVHNDGIARRTPGALVCCAPNSQIYNNTIANNALPGLAPYSSLDGAGTQIHNNIICGNSGSQLTAGQAATSHNLTSSSCPAFVNAGAGDFRLAPNSGVGADMGANLPPWR
jgi:nitrous oxidase accessory protein NosD